MTLILGHRGLSARHPENTLEAFRAALAAGMDGFELDVQPTVDGVAMVLHDDDLVRTARAPGILRRLRSAELPLLRNGEPVPRLVDALALGARCVNVELKGEPGWKQALAAVEAAGALDRVLFSSFEHSEVFQLWGDCPEARCGLLWETEEAAELTAEELDDLPAKLMLHVPVGEVRRRPAFWKPYGPRLVLWNLLRARDASDLDLKCAALIADEP